MSDISRRALLLGGAAAIAMTQSPPSLDDDDLVPYNSGVSEWYSKIPNLPLPENATMVVVQTRIHEADMPGITDVTSESDALRGYRHLVYHIADPPELDGLFDNALRNAFTQTKEMSDDA